MNADRFLAYYERIADAPDAATRLRGLILDLAVRGKLVPQNEDDEPASELMKRVGAERAKHARDKARTSERTEHRGPHLAPQGWAWVQLSDLVTVLNGRGYAKNELLSTGRTPVLRVGNLFTSSHWYYSNLELEDDKYCDAGDLLFAWSASFGPFIWPGPRVIYHYHIWKLELHSTPDLDRNYLFRFLQKQTQEIKSAGHGISMIHMTKGKMECVLVPVPPLAEQRRIVAKVDELMALCDRLEKARAAREDVRDRLAAASFARLDAPDSGTFHRDSDFTLEHLAHFTARPDQVKKLRQAILKLAVKGRLVRQEPEDEPASEVIRRMSKENARLAETRKSRKVAIDPVTQAEASFAVPNGWAWTRLGGVGDWGSGSTPPRGSPELYGGGVTWLKSGELNDNRHLAGSEETVSRLALEKGTFRVNQPGDVLIAMYGATIGKVAILAEEAVTNQAVCGCTPGSGVNNQYLFLFLVSQREQFHSASEGGAQPNISKEKIVLTPFPMPPVAEQRRIVAKVDQLMTLCDRIESQLTNGLSTQSSLFDAVLREATSAA